MFSYLYGTVAFQDDDAITLDVGGIGYHVFVARPGQYVVDSMQRLFVTEIIREDRFDLFGFASRDEQSLFLAFLNVQGVGPKSALKIVAADTADNLRRHIMGENISFFLGISGIGKKTAQKILLDLKGVLVNPEKVVADEVMDALLAMGYSQKDVIDVLSVLDRNAPTEQRLRAALRALAK